MQIERCYFPAEKGRCFARIQSWYYDHSEQTCKQFMYGGCGGNKNRLVEIV